MCKLLNARTFSHLQVNLDDPDIKSATDNWVRGEKKIVEWCQDQWRRKKNFKTGSRLTLSCPREKWAKNGCFKQNLFSLCYIQLDMVILTFSKA
jgi:hypothetical protein